MFSTHEPQTAKSFAKHSQPASLPNSSSQAPNSSQSFLFSPMKRLRIDECAFEKPDDSLSKNCLNDASEMNMTTPPKQIINFSKDESKPNCSMSSVKLLDMDSKQIANSQVNDHTI